MEEGITCRVVATDPDYLLIRVSANNGAFSGAVDAYILPDDTIKLASQLEGFPLSPKDTREIVFGAFGDGWAGGAAKLRFFSNDYSGHSWVEVVVEAGAYIAGVKQTTLLIMPVEAAGVDSFVSDLRKAKLTTDKAAVLMVVARGYTPSSQ